MCGTEGRGRGEEGGEGEGGRAGGQADGRVGGWAAGGRRREEGGEGGGERKGGGREGGRGREEGGREGGRGREEGGGREGEGGRGREEWGVTDRGREGGKVGGGERGRGRYRQREGGSEIANRYFNSKPIRTTIIITLHRQSWLEKRKVLTDRVEECHARQVAVSQKLTESRKEAKKVCRKWEEGMSQGGEFERREGRVKGGKGGWGV